MAKENFKEVLMNETFLGNSDGFYKAKFFQVDTLKYQLQIFKVTEKETEIETVKKEPVKIEVAKIRPMQMKGLSMADLEKRLKAVERYLKDVSIEEALQVDKKSKKLKAEVDLKFEVEKIFVEEIQIVDVPLIKKEITTDLKKEIFLDYFTPLKPKEIRKTVENYLKS